MHEEARPADPGRTANLLGAAALAVSDLMLREVTGAAGTSGSGAAALVVLAAEPGLSVTGLGRRVGLSQPAAARMVDTLERRGLVERRPTGGKWVAVHPTGEGRAAVRRLLDRRGERLGALVRRLEPADQAALAGVLERLLRLAFHGADAAGGSERLCRLCDRPRCTAGGAVCPVGQAERDAAG